MAAAWAAVAAALLAVALGVAASCARAVRALPRPEPGTVGFFHPFADGGGGGERVLWVGVRALQRAHPALKVFVYARAGVTAEQLARGAAERFGIELPRPIEVCFFVLSLVWQVVVKPRRADIQRQ
jgi:alpha-1,2-mannosyltransferase